MVELYLIFIIHLQGMVLNHTHAQLYLVGRDSVVGIETR